MQTILYFVLMFTISVANDVDVYFYNSYYSYKNYKTVQIPRLLVSFEYHDGDMLKMKIYLKNKPKNRNTDVYIKHVQGDNSQKKKLPICNPTGRNPCDISQHLKDKEIIIELVVSSTNGDCTTQQNIVDGKRVSHTSKLENNTPYKDICTTSAPCVIEVDLRNTSVCGNGAHTLAPTTTVSKETMTNKTSGSDDKSSDPQYQHTLIYAISSVIGMCVIILTIYICVKKDCHRNSRPVETMELNTNATVNEVVYADLGLAQVDSQPPRREESPYAEIVGVMKPVDGNVKKK